MTGEPTQTFVNPAEALAGAARLTQAGADFVSRWTEIKGRIEGYHNEAPWGTDQVGTDFSAQYLPPGEESGARAVVGGLTTLGDTLSQVGPSVTQAVTGSVETDDETGRSMAV